MSLTFQVDPASLSRTLDALTEFPKALRRKHYRIALSAGGGVFKRLVLPLVPEETGLLRRSMGVKVVIPNNPNKAAVSITGPRRGFKRAVYRTAKGLLRTAGKKRAVTAKKFRNPTRYAHLAGPRRKSTFMQRAAASGRQEALNKATVKLQEGVEQERRKLAAKTR